MIWSLVIREDKSIVHFEALDWDTIYSRPTWNWRTLQGDKRLTLRAAADYARAARELGWQIVDCLVDRGVEDVSGHVAEDGAVIIEGEE